MILKHDGTRPEGGYCGHLWEAGPLRKCPECGGTKGIVRTQEKTLPVGTPIYRRPNEK